MSALLSAVSFVEENVRADVAKLQDMVYSVNILQKGGKIKDLQEWHQKRMELEDSIKAFNFKQINYIQQNYSIDNTHLLLPIYLKTNTYIQATQKVSASLLRLQEISPAKALPLSRRQNKVRKQAQFVPVSS